MLVRLRLLDDLKLLGDMMIYLVGLRVGLSVGDSVGDSVGCSVGYNVGELEKRK